jgi:hypothetical protein
MAGPVSDPRTTARRRWTGGRVLTAVVVVGLVTMWVYVLYLAFGPGRQPPPDRLADPTFATAAQERCRATLDQVATLPRAIDEATPAERADVVTEANGLFETMLDDLAEMTPDGDDGELVTEWLADWRTYLGDREAYAVAVRTDPHARLLVSAKHSQQVTEYIDAFAGDNKMISCATPIDVG